LAKKTQATNVARRSRVRPPTGARRRRSNVTERIHRPSPGDGLTGPRKGGRVARMDASALFPTLSSSAHRYGLAIVLAIAERQGEDAQLEVARLERFAAKPGRGPKSAFVQLADAAGIAKTLAGLAHPDRVRIGRAILLGSHTHQLLREAVGIKTGPLYHHLRALERAGLITMADRNQYGLTRMGRAAILTSTSLAAAGNGGSGSWESRHLHCRSTIQRNGRSKAMKARNRGKLNVP